ncbi:hypothetical protein ACOMHN_025651 [Nucella lapillus]
MRQFPPCIPQFHGEKGQIRKVAMRINVITLRTRLTGVMAGLVLSVFFYSDLILRCGDVELNPGPTTKPGSSLHQAKSVMKRKAEESASSLRDIYDATVRGEGVAGLLTYRNMESTMSKR